MDFESLLPILFILIYFVSLVRKAARSKQQVPPGRKPIPNRSPERRAPVPGPQQESDWDRALREIREAMGEKEQGRPHAPAPAPPPPVALPVPPRESRLPDVRPSQPPLRRPVEELRTPEPLRLEPRTTGNPVESFLRVEEAGMIDSARPRRRAAASSPASATSAQEGRARLADLLRNPASLRDGFVLSEIFGPPRSRQH